MSFQNLNVEYCKKRIAELEKFQKEIERQINFLKAIQLEMENP